MRLLDLQRQFQHCLIEPKKHDARSIVVDTQEAPIDIRVGIYQEGYFLRLAESLQEDFQGLGALLGPEKFQTMISQYLLKYPSESFSMNHLGARLPAFIAEISDDVFLREMATFEWTLFSLLEIEKEPILTADSLQTVKETEFPYLVFQTKQAMQFLSMHTNVPQIWQSVQDKTRFPKKKHREKAQDYLIWEQGGDIHYQPISPKEHAALHAFQQGLPFSDVCEIACKHMPEHAVQGFIAELLHQWLSAELFVAPPPLAPPIQSSQSGS